MSNKWSHSVTVIREPGNEIKELKSIATPQIAIQIHIFFVELIDELIYYTNLMPYKFDCFISTDTGNKKKEIEKKFQENSVAQNVFVQVIPNQGRDVAPFIIQMAPQVKKYKYISHIHTKRSETVAFGDQWRRFLLKNLYGSREYLLKIFDLFEKNRKLGLIIPEIYPVIEKAATWSGTKEAVRATLMKMGIVSSLPEEPMFPAGDMFWARTDAIFPLFEQGYSTENFPEENGQVNFTFAHVIERIWVYLAQGLGYDYQICQNVITENSEKKENRIAIYVHYDKDNIISDVDRETIKVLNGCLDELVFISNSELPEQEINKIKDFTSKIYLRENKGFDFGAWQYCLLEIGIDYFSKFDQLLLTNNSCIGPFYDLNSIFNVMNQKQTDFWGLTLYPYCADGSFINAPYVPEHIQSYFIVFNQRVIQSKVFREFWLNYTPSNDFAETIAKGETKLTEKMNLADFSYSALLPESLDIGEWHGTDQPQNELAYQFAILGTPFIKKKASVFLTEDNRSRLIDYLTQLCVPESFVQYYENIPTLSSRGRGKNLVRRIGGSVKDKCKKILSIKKRDSKKAKIIDFYQFVIDKETIPLNQNEYEVHKRDKVKILNWIIPDMGVGSGGHISMFRFISRLENMGFHSRIYLYKSLNYHSDEEIRAFLKDNFQMLDDRVEIYSDVSKMEFAHGTIATFWHTAYYLRKYNNTISKFYFIQDYEPFFYPKGSDYQLADATYHFGFRGITAGEWLKDKVYREAGMHADSFKFSYDREVYAPHEKRGGEKKIFFYARPVTPRRDFELGLLALQELCRRMPEVKIVFAGWDTNQFVIPFPHENLGIVDVKNLSVIYADCDMCLVISNTNLSLLPLEIMASNSVAVCSKGHFSSWLVNEENAILVSYDPYEIADKIEYYLKHEDQLAKIREKGRLFAESTSWDDEAVKLRDALLKGIAEDEQGK